MLGVGAHATACSTRSRRTVICTPMPSAIVPTTHRARSSRHSSHESSSGWSRRRRSCTPARGADKPSGLLEARYYHAQRGGALPAGTGTNARVLARRLDALLEARHRGERVVCRRAQMGPQSAHGVRCASPGALKRSGSRLYYIKRTLFDSLLHASPLPRVPTSAPQWVLERPIYHICDRAMRGRTGERF